MEIETKCIRIRPTYFLKTHLQSEIVSLDLLDLEQPLSKYNISSGMLSFRIDFFLLFKNGIFLYNNHLTSIHSTLSI